MPRFPGFPATRVRERNHPRLGVYDPELGKVPTCLEFGEDQVEMILYTSITMNTMIRIYFAECTLSRRPFLFFLGQHGVVCGAVCGRDGWQQKEISYIYLAYIDAFM